MPRVSPQGEAGDPPRDLLRVVVDEEVRAARHEFDGRVRCVLRAHLQRRPSAAASPPRRTAQASGCRGRARGSRREDVHEAGQDQAAVQLRGSPRPGRIAKRPRRRRRRPHRPSVAARSPGGASARASADRREQEHRPQARRRDGRTGTTGAASPSPCPPRWRDSSAGTAAGTAMAMLRSGCGPADRGTRSNADERAPVVGDEVDAAPDAQLIEERRCTSRGDGARVVPATSVRPSARPREGRAR